MLFFTFYLDVPVSKGLKSINIQYPILYMHCSLSVFVLFIFVAGLQAQQSAVIRAYSRDLVVQDGSHIIRGVIVPEAKPDVYWVEMPKKGQRISIHTDSDSMVWVSKFGQDYDFVILLNDRDSCHFRISAQPRLPNGPKNCALSGRDTLPFELRNNRIFLKGKINDASDVLIQFDLGAGTTSVNHRSHDKIPIKFDTETYLINSQGGNKARASTKNTLEIGHLKWENEYLVETKNMERWEDAIVGNTLFLDKCIEIDYDNKRLIIYEKMPAIDSAYTKHDMFLDGGVRPCMQFSIGVDGKTYTHWYVFDTGNTSNGQLSKAVTSIPAIYENMTKFIGMGHRKVGILPQLFVDGHAFKDLVFTLEKPQSTMPAGELGIIGNAILNRFNVLIDNEQGFIYLKPNSLMDHPLETKQSVFKKIGIGVGSFIGILLVAIVIIKRKKK